MGIFTNYDLTPENYVPNNLHDTCKPYIIPKFPLIHKSILFFFQGDRHQLCHIQISQIHGMRTKSPAYDSVTPFCLVDIAGKTWEKLCLRSN